MSVFTMGDQWKAGIRVKHDISGKKSLLLGCLGVKRPTNS